VTATSQIDFENRLFYTIPGFQALPAAMFDSRSRMIYHVAWAGRMVDVTHAAFAERPEVSFKGDQPR